MNRLLGIVALGAIAGGLPACGPGEETSEPDAREPIPVTVAAVAAMDTAERLEAGGVVTARESAAISSRIVAPVARVHVTAGDRVRAGDVLVTLDARDVAERAEQARAGALAAEKMLAQVRLEQSAAQAEHRLAAAWHERIAALHARKAATDHERDEAEARLATAAARLAGTQAAIDGADAQLAAARAAGRVGTATESFTDVRAPFDGLVSERLTDPGNLATPGLALLRIESDGARQVVARVDEARAGYLQVGDAVSVSIGDSSFDGVVAEVARAVGTDQRAFTIEVGLPPAVTARTGSFARLVFAGAPRRALFVAADAVQRHGQVSSVYVVEDGVARLRLIQAGASTPDGVEVLAGLDAGESVVISPLARLTDGARVTGGTP
jgi:RND family efflux transporter MFP subunit